jgi:hypothetical protein
MVVLLLALAGTGGMLYGIYHIVSQFKGGSGPASGDLREFNCNLDPPAGWHFDRGLAEELHVLYALRRSDPAGHFALEVVDFKDRFPSKGALLELFKDRIGSYFAEFAWQPKAPATVDKLDKLGTLAKQPAYVLEFEGTHDEVAFEGECHVIEHRGFVYWFIVFARPTSGEEKETLQKEWEKLRGAFTLLDRREGWQPRPRKTQPFAGKGYEIAYPTDVWKKPEVDNPNAASELMLHGTDPRQERDGEESKAGRTVTLHVVKLGKPPDKDPGKLLREHFIGQQAELLGAKREDLKLTPETDRKGKPREGEADVGKARGFLSKSRLSLTGGSVDRFVVLASVPHGEGSIGIYCDSPYKYRAFWEQEVNALLESFKLDSGK